MVRPRIVDLQLECSQPLLAMKQFYNGLLCLPLAGESEEYIRFQVGQFGATESDVDNAFDVLKELA